MTYFHASPTLAILAYGHWPAIVELKFFDFFLHKLHLMTPSDLDPKVQGHIN